MCPPPPPGLLPQRLPTSRILRRMTPKKRKQQRQQLTTPSPRSHTTGVIEYLRRFGYSDYQIYLLLSCAPVQGHVAGIVDIPNACTTIGLPVDIFDFDITPAGTLAAGAGVGAKKLDMGTCAFETGATEGLVTAGGKNSEHSFGGGLTYKS